jgi:hypothetical protein
MTDEEVLEQIKFLKDVNSVQIMRKYKYTYVKALQIVEMWKALQPPPPPIYKKEGKKLRRTKWNIGDRLFENYTEWKEAMNQ